jgi:uncharacterized protein
VHLSVAEARRVWMHAQRLDARAPFASGPEATVRAVEHLGYVQIDTIFVIERSHHHILWSRIPGYQRAHLHRAQTTDKTVFEYWAHALAYLPTRDLRYFVTEMARYTSKRWFGTVKPSDIRKIVERLEGSGPLAIRDIDDDVLVDKHHPWASKKPSKRALELAFFKGLVTIAARTGIEKTYDLFERHLGPKPVAARPAEIAAYRLDRALRAQGLVSLASVCHLDAPRKPAVLREIEARVRRGLLTPVRIDGQPLHWMSAETDVPAHIEPLVHILNPFDPLVIQRKRLEALFGYAHRFEAYLPKEKRVFGYFGLPVLVGDRVVAVIDTKADRSERRLLIQKWTWLPKQRSPETKRSIEEELGRFEAFQVVV